ncbi:hypothetical protein UFOVP813_3 [uncultured Caudovirales phage]|uniref:Uncharacterized protein n=1 Tax=uncultured Caudovirales phage TaxID=2100421 RepID=A0A6J5P1J2_9CAUD|nr:hypothetical protein UFOVP813_3 [uncultured Caudovirales phage]
MKAEHLCKTKWCRNDRGAKSPVCSKCAMRKWRARNPMKAQYLWLCRSAEKRGIAVTITFDEFSAWAIENDYFTRVGRSPDSVHCDRIDSTRGYSLDNIRILTASINCSKGAWSERKSYYEHNYSGAESGAIDCPF